MRAELAAQSFIPPSLKTSEDGDGTVSLGNLFHCIIALMVKKFLHIASLSIPCLD